MLTTVYVPCGGSLNKYAPADVGELAFTVHVSWLFLFLLASVQCYSDFFVRAFIERSAGDESSHFTV